MWTFDCREGSLGVRKGLDETGERIVDCGKEVFGGGRLWMRRVNVGIIETERCI